MPLECGLFRKRHLDSSVDSAFFESQVSSREQLIVIAHRGPCSISSAPAAIRLLPLGVPEDSG